MNPEGVLLVVALSGQVFSAMESAKDRFPGLDITELDIRTVITRPMWQAFCSAAGISDGPCEPTEWLGPNNTRRVCGSETIVVESDEWWSASWIRGS